MNKEQLNNFFISVNPTDKQKERVLNNILSKRERPFNKKIPIALVAVLVLVLGSITVMSARFGWHQVVIEYFNPTPEQISMLDHSTNTPMVTQTKNGVSVTILQTLADKHGIYVLYEITAPDDFAFNDDIRWYNQHLVVDYPDKDKKPGIGGSMSYKVLSQSGNKRTVLLCRNGSGDIQNQMLKMKLSDMGYFESYDPLEFNTLIECDFEITWEFNYENAGKTIDVNYSVIIAEGHNNKVMTIDISPLSLWIEIAGDDVIMAIQPVINFKDGSKMIIDIEENENLYRSYTPLYGGVNSFGMYFEDFINVDEVESITIGDKVVTID